MKIQYRPGNLLEAEERFIAQGCNAQGKMGKGLALAIKENLPYAYDAYMVRFNSEGLRLGQTIWALPPKGFHHTVINCITQDRYRKTYEDDNVVYADYEAILKCVRQINNTAFVSRELNARWLGGPIDAVAFPLIGAGLAGGDWAIIAAIIEEEATEFQPVVYLNGQKVPE